MRRISSLPRLLACPSSGLPTEREYDPQSEVADGGTAGHLALAHLATGQAPDIAAIAAKFDGVGQDDIEFMYQNGCRAWDEVGKFFSSPRAEERLESEVMQIKGTADMFHNDGSTMAVLDWKSNRQKAIVMDQVRGYATAAVDMYGMPDSGYVTIIVVWIRLGEYELYNLDADDILTFRQRLRYANQKVGKSYAPGDSCLYCPRQLECEARRDMMRSAVWALAPHGKNQAPVSREKLARLYPYAKMVKHALDAYNAALRVGLAEGPLSDGAGNELSLEEETRDKIDARKAWPILEGHGFDADDLAGCISISKTAVLRVTGDKATAGRKGKAKAAITEQLREAGAITQKAHWAIRSKKESNHD